MAILGFYLWGYSLTTEKGLVLHEARHLGESGSMPPQRKFCISDILRLFLEVIAITIPLGFISIGRLKRRNREPVCDVHKNESAWSAIATHTCAAELKPKKPP